MIYNYCVFDYKKAHLRVQLYPHNAYLVFLPLNSFLVISKLNW